MSVYLDNASTSYPKAPGVGQAMAAYIDNVGSNINRGVYEPASQAALTVLEAREMLCRLFHYTGPETHCLFTPGVTAALNTVMKGYLASGDHVVVSAFEHNAVMRPLAALSDYGVSFSRIGADRDGVSDMGSFARCLRPNTKLVLVSHASNVSGGLLPLGDIAAACGQRGIPLVVDASQTAGHYPIDFEALNLAALCVPGHKGLLGPQGIGAMLVSESFAQKLTPLTMGGTGSVSDSERQPAYMPDKFESGTLNLPGIYGLHRAVEFVLERGVESLRRHETALTAQLLSGLAELPVRVVGVRDAEKRVGVVSVDFTGSDNARIAQRLERDYGVLVRCGLHCAPNAHKTLGTFPHGTVRFSAGWATTKDDIAQAVDAIRDILNH